MSVVVLDGPVGTELAARGVPTPLPLWSAAAIRQAPDVLADIHRAYADAGATVHTANTFRTKRRTIGADWRTLVREAVAIARSAIGSSHRLAGSIAPLEDCYRPDLSPPDAEAEHRELALALAHDGVDLLLCETFPHPAEAVAATRAAASTGLPVWTSLTAGPWDALLTPEAVTLAAEQVVAAGAQAVLVNCSKPRTAVAYVAALAGLGVPFGCYANAGDTDDGLGWGHPEAPEAYAELAQGWVQEGATLIGSCCGTGPEHTRALARRFAGTAAP